MLKIRRSRDRLILNMGIPYLGKTVFMLRRGRYLIISTACEISLTNPLFGQIRFWVYDENTFTVLLYLPSVGQNGLTRKCSVPVHWVEWLFSLTEAKLYSPTVLLFQFLTYWGSDKMTALLWTPFSNWISRNLFARAQLTKKVSIGSGYCLVNKRHKLRKVMILLTTLQVETCDCRPQTLCCSISLYFLSIWRPTIRYYFRPPCWPGVPSFRCWKCVPVGGHGLLLEEPLFHPVTGWWNTVEEKGNTAWINLVAGIR